MRSWLAALTLRRRLTMPVLRSIMATMAPNPAINLLRMVSLIKGTCLFLMEIDFDHFDRLDRSLGEDPLLDSGDGCIAQQGVSLHDFNVFDFTFRIHIEFQLDGTRNVHLFG